MHELYKYFNISRNLSPLFLGRSATEGCCLAKGGYVLAEEDHTMRERSGLCRGGGPASIPAHIPL